MGDEPFARIRGQDPDQCGERRRGCRLRDRNAGEGRRGIELQGHAGAARQDAGRQDRECPDLGKAHRFAGQNNPFATLPILELNAKHALIQRLRETVDDAAFSELGHVLYDQAMLAEGGELDDPAIFVRRVNKLIVDGLSAAPKIILG